MPYHLYFDPFPEGRRKFLRKLAALSATTAMGLSSSAADKRRPAESFDRLVLHDDEHIVIKGGYILSMDEQVGDLPQGDVHIHQGTIVNVGKHLDVTGARILDASQMIVMPGMIDTHWHVWTSVLRAMAGEIQDVGYFDITTKFGALFTPADMYISTRLAMTEAVHSGITYVHDWCHNVRSYEHAEAGIMAIEDQGVRARFSVGLPAGADQQTSKVDMGIIERLLQRQKNAQNNGLVSIGLAWPEPGTDSSLRTDEIEMARQWGTPISVHASRKPDKEDSITKIKDFLDKDVQIIHGVQASEAELKMMAESGAALSISPYSELRVGYGFPPVPEMLASGIPIGLSVDTFPLSGNADMFAVMKIFLNLANGLSEDEFITSGRRILELATIEGARSMGMDATIGSLVPGKRADIIMIDTMTPNMVPFTDPIMLAVTAAQPANVDTVIIDGKIHKHQGKILKDDTHGIFDQANMLVQRLRKEADW